MFQQSFDVTGLTCDHCAAAITEEVSQIVGVTDVTVDLVAGGTSTLRVESDETVGDHALTEALAEAGDYTLAGPTEAV